MNIMFLDGAWQDYLYWQRCDPALCEAVSFRTAKDARERATRQKTDKKVLKRINQLIKDTQRTPFAGIGKPEPLKFDMSGLWSRRINQEHRLIYQVQDSHIVIVQCRYHY
jgi:toxin YoeB